MELIKQNPLARVLAVAAVVIAGWLWYSPADRLLITYWIGVFTPGLVIAAVIGFLAWNKKAWLWSSVALVVATVALQFR